MDLLPNPNGCSDKFTLYWLNEILEGDAVFSEQALAVLRRMNAEKAKILRDTITKASAASALINEWLINRDLPCYSRGRLVDDVADLMIEAHECSPTEALEILESDIEVKRDDLVRLIEKEDMRAPLFLLHKIPLANAVRLLVEMQLGKNSNDASIVQEYEQKWQAVIDHLLRQGKLPLLVRSHDDGVDCFEPTTEMNGAWITTEELRRIFANPPSEVIEEFEQQQRQKSEERAKKEAARRAAGRYTILEAAEELAEKTGCEVKRWIEVIVDAILEERQKGKVQLSAKNPKDFTDPLPYTPSKISGYDYEIRDYYEQVDKQDVNKWLAAHPEWGATLRLGDEELTESSAALQTGAENNQGNTTEVPSNVAAAGNMFLRTGNNRRADLKAYIEQRAPEVARGLVGSPTGEKIAQALDAELRRFGYQGERDFLSVSTITRLLPTGLTGGRAKNGRKARTS